jgi:hypothetical protein
LPVVVNLHPPSRQVTTATVQQCSISSLANATPPVLPMRCDASRAVFVVRIFVVNGPEPFIERTHLSRRGR